MRPAQGVSFPRSGHALVYWAARNYFGDRLIYCDPDDEAHCGCGSVPCSNPRRSFAKNHDFDLVRSQGIPLRPGERYLVQYRNPVRSIASNFLLEIANNPDSDNRETWERFAFRSVYHWNRFIDKWVLDFPADFPRPLVCSYEALLADPQARLLEILAFMADGPVDEQKARTQIAQMGIAPRDRLADFPYHDPALFDEMEEAAAERMAELGMVSWKDEGSV